MKILKLLCLTFCAISIMLFSACSGALNEPVVTGGSLSLNLTDVLNHYKTNSRSALSVPPLLRSEDGVRDDLTEEEREIYNIIMKTLKYKAEVSLIEQDGTYAQSDSKEAPFSEDPEPDFFKFQFTDIPVGITAVIHVDIHFEGKEESTKALTSYVRENMGMPDPDDKYVDYIVRMILGTDFDFKIEGDSDPVLIVAGDNPVIVKLTSNQEDVKEGSTGIQIDMENIRQPLKLAWKDESDDSSFKFIIKMATDGYENPHWIVNNSEITDSRTDHFQDYHITFQKEGDKLVITSEGTPLLSLDAFASLLTNGNLLSIKCTATRNGISDTAELLEL